MPLPCSAPFYESAIADKVVRNDRLPRLVLSAYADAVGQPNTMATLMRRTLTRTKSPILGVAQGCHSVRYARNILWCGGLI
jgi:hypothetical protein